MIIGDFDLVGAISHPHKTNPPLIVEPDTMLSGSISFQLLQSVSGRCQQVFEIGGAVEHSQLSFGHFPNARELFDSLSRKQTFRLLVPKPSNHGLTLPWFYDLRKADVPTVC